MTENEKGAAATVPCANCPLPVFYDEAEQVWRHDEHEGITCGSDAYAGDGDVHAEPAATTFTRLSTTSVPLPTYPTRGE